MGSVPGNNRRGAAQLDRKYGFGNQDTDVTAFCNFDPLPAVLGAVAGSNPSFSITGTGTVPASALLNPSNTRPGGILLASRTTGTTINDEARLTPYAVSQFAQQLRPTVGEQTVIDLVVRVTQNTLIQIYAGAKLSDTGVVATDADQVLFLFDTVATANFGPAGSGTLAVSANWYAVASTGGNDLARDTGVPVTLDRDFRLKITLRPDGVPQFYINNGAPLTIPGQGPLTAAAALQVRMGLATRAAAAANCGLRSARFSRRVPN